jgi:hypothetical protein
MFSTPAFKAARNVAIIVVIAALVVVIPGGGTGANVATQAVWLVFLGALGWWASIMYRQHRVALYSLGDRKRALLYGAIAVATLTFTGTSRLWKTGAGILVWFVLIGGAAYAVFTVIWSAREY